MTQPKFSLDVAFVNPFIQATEITLGKQASTPAAAGKPQVKATGTTDIAGVIQLKGKHFQGAIALCFPSSVFLGIYARMTGEKIALITPEVEDTASELLNIIFGQAKILLNDQQGHGIQMAIPQVVRGTKLRAAIRPTAFTLVIPFKTELGEFQLEIHADPAEKSAV